MTPTELASLLGMPPDTPVENLYVRLRALKAAHDRRAANRVWAAVRPHDRGVSGDADMDRMVAEISTLVRNQARLTG